MKKSELKRMIKEELKSSSIKEAEVKLNPMLKKWLDKLISVIQEMNLTKIRKYEILKQIALALDIDTAKFVQFTQKIKKEI